MWRWLLLIALVPYAAWLMFGYAYHFLDHVNLVFHEAGHVLFSPFGDTLQLLGGTVGQLIFPVATAIHFWRREQAFEAAIGGVWLAESLMYAAHYMSDAQTRALPLVGGGEHDWYLLFGRWGVLAHAEGIGAFFHLTASVLLIASLAFMYKQLVSARGVRDRGTPR